MTSPGGKSQEWLPDQVPAHRKAPIKDVRWLNYGGSTARAKGMLVLAVMPKPSATARRW